MTDRKRREVNTAFVRRHYAIGPTAYDATTGNPLRWPTPADVAYCEQQFDRWLAAHDAEIREQTLAPIQAALDGHPVYNVHPDGDPVSCGWKRAVADVRRALDA